MVCRSTVGPCIELTWSGFVSSVDSVEEGRLDLFGVVRRLDQLLDVGGVGLVDWDVVVRVLVPAVRLVGLKFYDYYVICPLGCGSGDQLASTVEHGLFV